MEIAYQVPGWQELGYYSWLWNRPTIREFASKAGKGVELELRMVQREVW